jgi:hypothetical protein
MRRWRRRWRRRARHDAAHARAAEISGGRARTHAGPGDRAPAGGWTGGLTVSALQAQSADRFVSASRGAEAQIDQAEARARGALAAAQAALAAEQARYQQLDTAQRDVNARLARAAEVRAELAQPWRPQPPRPASKTGF